MAYPNYDQRINIGHLGYCPPQDRFTQTHWPGGRPGPSAVERNRRRIEEARCDGSSDRCGWESDGPDDFGSRRIGKSGLVGLFLKGKLAPSTKKKKKSQKKTKSSSSRPKEESSRRHSTDINKELGLPGLVAKRTGLPRGLSPKISLEEQIRPANFTPDLRPSTRGESSRMNLTPRPVRPESYSFTLEPSHRPGRSRSVNSHQTKPESYAFDLQPSHRPNPVGLNNLKRLPSATPPSKPRDGREARLAEIGNMNRTFLDGFESASARDNRTKTVSLRGGTRGTDLAQMKGELGNMNRTYLEGMVSKKK